jgi:hypothetical protein
MDHSNKSNITTVTSGNNKSITWGTKSSMNFSSDNTVNGGSKFCNTVGTTINFAGGPQLLWSTAVTLNYDLKDVYRYHLRGSTSIGRNTAMKHQTYFYTTAGFDPDMSKATEQYFSRVDNSAYRYKLTNYVLKFMSLSYKIMGYADLVNEKVMKQPATTWTESTRQALQKGTSGVVYALDKVRSLVNSTESWFFKSGFWKNFVRNDFQPNALAQVSSTKGVFLGAQYENGARAGERTTAALYLDNTIRLRASSTLAEDAASVFYPRDIQPQGIMKPQDWISPEKVITEITSRIGKEPTEYAAFNGFKVPVDSSLDIGPAGIDSCSTAITSQAVTHTQKSVTRAVLEYKIAQSLADEIKVKLEIAKKQVRAITGDDVAVDGEEIAPLSPAEMAMAPLAAAAKAADKTQKAFLLAEATMLVKKLMEESAKAELISNEKKLAADASKDFSELKTSADFFEITHESGKDKVSIKGSQDALQLAMAESIVQLTEHEAYMTVQGKGMAISAADITLSVNDQSGLLLSSSGATFKGGGSEIKLANSSVTIGDLKINQVGSNTKLNLVEKSNDQIKKLEKSFEGLERSFNQSIEQKDKEIQALKQQIANLGNSAKSKKKK